MIISIGYRVKSQNGIIFRKWANNVLKEFLLKGYCISNRALVSKDNYFNLYNKVISLDTQVSKIKKQIANIKPDSQIFYKVEYFESNLFVKNIVNDAKNELIVIDPYFEEKSLNNLKIKKNIKFLMIKAI